jgi:hypothetical protein
MSNSNVKAFFGLPLIAAILLQFFFGGFFNIFGTLYRFQKGKILMGLLSLIFCLLFWWIDMISLIVNKDLKWLV